MIQLSKYHYSAVAETLVCYDSVVATNPKYSLVSTAVKNVNSIPARSIQAISLQNIWYKVPISSPVLVKETSLFTNNLL